MPWTQLGPAIHAPTLRKRLTPIAVSEKGGRYSFSLGVSNGRQHGIPPTNPATWASELRAIRQAVAAAGNVEMNRKTSGFDTYVISDGEGNQLATVSLRRNRNTTFDKDVVIVGNAEGEHAVPPRLRQLLEEANRNYLAALDAEKSKLQKPPSNGKQTADDALARLLKAIEEA